MRSRLDEHAAEEASTAPSPRQVLVRIVLLSLGARFVLQLTGVTALWTHGRELSPRALLDLWVAWDAFAYLRVAERGYPQTGEGALDVVFLPLFPFLTGVVSVIVRDPAAAGFVVSFLASVAAGWLLYRLVRLDGSHDEAWRAVLLLFTFPTAYFLAAPYTESLFLAAVLASVYAARTGRWGWAGLGGAVATATRLTGLALLPALGLQGLRQTGDVWQRGRRVIWAGLAASGFGIYLVINAVIHGDPFTFVTFQSENWQNEPAWPWQPLIDSVATLLDGGLTEDFLIIHWGRLGATVLTAGLLVAGRRRLPFADAAYAWVALVFVLSSTWLISLPRYVLVLYPIFAVMARFSTGTPVLAAFLGAGVVLQLFLFWRYALGWWTF